LRDIVQDVTGLPFNSVLANLYRDGSDSMGWHADNEQEVGPRVSDRHIASLSFGATRRFLVRSNEQKVKHEFRLASGDLLVMRGTAQCEFKHSLPKTAKAVGPRVNLTFRKIVARA
jgi:alkylated DNA repair dioxygenase AlkB